jgi:hypothetical protein
MYLDWIQELSFQGIFNPNADFIPNQNLGAGNDELGIWSVNAGFFPLGPGVNARIGKGLSAITEPDEWDHEGFEYGLKIESLMFDSIASLNFWYGRSNDPTTINTGGAVVGVDGQGNPEISFMATGYYPRQKLIGATFTRAEEMLRLPFGSATIPVIRLEAFYQKDNILSTGFTYSKNDEYRFAIGYDSKVQVPWLNPKSGISFSAQVIHRHICDYPTGGLFGVEEDTWTTTLMVDSNYLLARLTPSFFWMNATNDKANLFIYKIKYARTESWTYTVGAVVITGQETGGLNVFDNKDHLYCKIEYTFN